jgi:DNA-binding winged helix-turn-helix (wHTH) protein
VTGVQTCALPICDGAPAPINARYLDALALMVREPGKLVTKDRFLEEVWAGVPVTDEALTQCVRSLRKLLDDDAANPRFIETVPKHGYRFVASVETADDSDASPPLPPPPPPPPPSMSSRDPEPGLGVLRLGLAGTLGGGLAGAIGGLVYGFIGAAQPVQGGMGAISILLVLLSVSALVGLLGGAGVGFGLAAGELVPGRPWWRGIAGGALGGLVIGACVKLLGLDAFALLLGHAPGDITGAFEGLTLGAAVGLGVWLARHEGRRGLTLAALVGGATGLAIALMGGRLMAGSLDVLARSFPGSRLSLDRIGGLFGEHGLGASGLLLTTAAEGALFALCIAALARKAASRR